MYAIIEVGAKQYNVKKDDIIDVELMHLKEGKEVAINTVLMAVKDKQHEFGRPYIKEARVEAVSLGEVKGPKAVSLTYRRRKSSHRKVGFRPKLTRLKIKDIILG